MSSSTERFALSFDLGTTTIAASLANVATGERVATAGAENPQRRFGLDVTARLSAGLADAEARREMSRLAARKLEELGEHLLAEAGVSWGAVSLVAVAANTVVTHLLLGLPLESLAFPPYRPLVREESRTATGRIGWRRDLPLYVFPLPGGYVGGDLVACLFGFRELPDRSLFLDLGTNCEIAVTNGARILTTSAAAGPAFEAGNLACGMHAAPGAITGITVEGERLKNITIGGAVPRGICGSAALGIVTLLLRHDVIDRSGRLRPPEEIPSNLGNRIITVMGEPAFLLHRDAAATIYLSQKDIRELQVAKGAIRAGIEVLLSRGGFGAVAPEAVFITGSFGVEVAAEHLKTVGVLAEKMVHVTRFFREGALAGVERLAVSGDFAGVDALAARIDVIPLSGTPAFEKHFLSNMDFPT